MKKKFYNKNRCVENPVGYIKVARLIEIGCAIEISTGRFGTFGYSTILRVGSKVNEAPLLLFSYYDGWNNENNTLMTKEAMINFRIPTKKEIKKARRYMKKEERSIIFSTI